MSAKRDYIYAKLKSTKNLAERNPALFSNNLYGDVETPFKPIYKVNSSAFSDCQNRKFCEIVKGLERRPTVELL